MTLQFDPTTLAVCLKASTVSLLFDRRQHTDETLDEIVYRLTSLAPCPVEDAAQVMKMEPAKPFTEPETENSKYCITLFEATVDAKSLGRLFAEFVDLLDRKRCSDPTFLLNP